MVKRRRDWGRERKRHDSGGFIVFWISIPKKRKFLIGWLLVNLSTKNLSLEGAQFPLWLKHLQNMVNKHGSRTALQCSKTSLCFCGTWNIFSTKYNLFFAPSKFPYTTARDQWQILQYCDASWPFSLCFLLTLRNPLFSECLGFITTPSLQYLMLPNQTAENGQVVFSKEKAHKMMSIVKKEGTVN